MKDISLLVMAAGMGSRYGGLKQLDKIGPNGETIIDYSVYDAIRAGFSKVVFIIRKEFENEFRQKVGNKFSSNIEVDYAFQDLNDLPSGFNCPADREKPWGTGHAILSAKSFINEPFYVINGDDFYGLRTFETAAEFYKSGADIFSMIAFQMDKTLSEFGTVTRGVCQVQNNCLKSIIETEGLQKVNDTVLSANKDITFTGNEPVSMNMWGFTPRLFTYLEDKFRLFLNEHGNELKSEFFIPTVVNELIETGQEKVQVVQSPENWFGVTYKDDKPFVQKKIAELVQQSSYPKSLF